MAANDDYQDKGAGGLHDVRPQPGRGVHLPVAQPDPGDIYDEFLAMAAIRTKAVRQGDRWTPRR